MCGVIKFKVCAKNPEVIINRLRGSIPIRKLSKSDKDTITFITDYKSGEYVLKIAEECNVKAEIIYKFGVASVIAKIKKRAGLYLGTTAAVLLVLYSSMFIWEVRVEGNTYVSDADIIRTLKTYGIYEGAKKDRDILEKAYNSFLMAENRISWLSVNYDGTVAHIEVKETKQIPKKLDRTRNINIVAECDGVVKRVDAFDGTAEVKSGETVTKGQLLISSFVETKKTGTIMNAARGNVWASTVHNFDIYVPKEQYILTEAALHISRYYYVLGKGLSLNILPINDKRTHKKSTEISRVILLDNIELPMVMRKDLIQYYTKEKEVIDVDSAYQAAQAELSKRVLSLEDAEVIGTKYEVKEDDCFYVYSFELECIENIAIEKEFELKEEEPV